MNDQVIVCMIIKSIDIKKKLTFVIFYDFNPLLNQKIIFVGFGSSSAVSSGVWSEKTSFQVFTEKKLNSQKCYLKKNSFFFFQS